MKVNSVLSEVLEMQYGITQGKVLGPIVFLICINDLLELEFHSDIFAYADDTTLVCSSYNRKPLKLQIRRDLDKIQSWLIINKLLIIFSKSKCLMFLDCS